MTKAMRSYLVGGLFGALGIILLVGLLLRDGKSRYFAPSDLPDPTPSEAKRIALRKGYSVICPKGWNASFTDLPDDDEIQMWSREFVGRRRYGSFFSVKSCTRPPLGQQTTASQLPDGRSIQVAIERRERVFLENPDTTRFRIYLADFPGEIIIVCHTKLDDIPPCFIPYIMSLKYESKD